jgi:hypothetical protein
MSEIELTKYLDDKFRGLNESIREIKVDMRAHNETIIRLQLVQTSMSQDFNNAQNINRKDHEKYEKSLESLKEVILKSDPEEILRTVTDHGNKFKEIAGAVKSIKVFVFIAGSIFGLVSSFGGIQGIINWMHHK